MEYQREPEQYFDFQRTMLNARSASILELHKSRVATEREWFQIAEQLYSQFDNERKVYKQKHLPTKREIKFSLQQLKPLVDRAREELNVLFEEWVGTLNVDRVIANQKAKIKFAHAGVDIAGRTTQWEADQKKDIRDWPCINLSYFAEQLVSLGARMQASKTCISQVMRNNSDVESIYRHKNFTDEKRNVVLRFFSLLDGIDHVPLKHYATSLEPEEVEYSRKYLLEAFSNNLGRHFLFLDVARCDCVLGEDMSSLLAQLERSLQQ